MGNSVSIRCSTWASAMKCVPHCTRLSTVRASVPKQDRGYRQGGTWCTQQSAAILKPSHLATSPSCHLILNIRDRDIQRSLCRSPVVVLAHAMWNSWRCTFSSVSSSFPVESRYLGVSSRDYGTVRTYQKRNVNLTTLTFAGGDKPVTPLVR
jgi:hypothetical protein